jgi:radical SAM superfamily enzyme YgiQ (UPF0313 family)
MKFKCFENPDNISYDVVITTVPYTETGLPLMAPAVLKPIVEKAGFSCLAADANNEVVNYINDHTLSADFMTFMYDEYLAPEITDDLYAIFYNMATQLMSFKPKFVGISLISYVNQISAKWLTWFVKKIDPTVVVLIGGPGCLPTFTGPSEFVDTLKDVGFVDYHIRGDAEHSLYEFLKGRRNYYGINSLEWREFTLEEMRKFPMPDYSQYNMDLYRIPALPIIGSRGCVRRCKFCDYIANWPSFTWRTADDIVDEMISQYKKYGIRNFKFQDSLTNGNQKEFEQFITQIAEWNNANPKEKFTWSGYYIFREHNSASEKTWQLIKESGGYNLIVGIENINQRIRYALGKKFSNEAIDIHLAYAKKYSIRLSLLNIVGWIDETDDEIEFIKNWLRTHTEYKKDITLQWGGTLGIFPNTWLEKNWENLGLVRTTHHPQGWENPAVGSTPEKRARWTRELVDLSKELGYIVGDQLNNHFLLEKMMNNEV